MIYFICFGFICLAMSLSLLMSYTFRLKLKQYFISIRISSLRKWLKFRIFAQQFNHAAAAEHTQQHWYLQQWWVLIAGLFLFSSILLFAFNRPIPANKIEAEYLKTTDPQIYHLLKGEMLTPPPAIDEALINAAIVQAQISEVDPIPSDQLGQTIEVIDPNEVSDRYASLNTDLVHRKWDRMNPRYKQRLLMVFKIMKQQYHYDLVLLEGYRSPARQNKLASNPNTTRAQAYQSYHQFGLAADIAFLREGKVIISEKDPWAMQAYARYGEVAESVGLTWGGHWKSIKDYGHSEYRLPGLKKTAEIAQQLSSEGQLATDKSRENNF